MKRSIGVSPFQLVYGAEVVFPTHLALSVAKFLQDLEGEPDHMIRRIHQMVEVQQIREQTMNRAYIFSKRSSKPLTGKAKRKFSSWVIWCSNGMHPCRTGASIVSLMPSGLGLSRSLKYFQTTLTGCRIWKARKFLAAQ